MQQNHFFIENGVLFRYTGNETDVTIPHGVTALSRNVFRNCRGIRTVRLPDTITEIGEGAFRSCSSLTEITIPRGVAAIGDMAFLGCSALESIRVDGQNPVYQSDEDVLYDKKGTLICCPAGIDQISFTVPQYVKKIGFGAFYGCERLTSVTLPRSLTELGSHAFHHCAGLTAITIPAKLTVIGRGAFCGCRRLKAFSVSVKNPSYCTDKGVLYNRRKTKLISYPAGSDRTDYVIPEKVWEIELFAFNSCSRLECITLPVTIEWIGYRAFSDCPSLNLVRYAGSSTQLRAIEIDSGNDRLVAATWRKPA